MNEIIPIEIQAEWFYNGALDDPKPSKEHGVYIFVYEGKSKRIVYVGTARRDNFSSRWSYHLNLFKTGRRTAWRVSEDEDIYCLMSYNNDMAKYYKNLASESKLWVPNKQNNEDINYLCENDTFKDNWKAYIEDHYIKKLKVWSCPIKNDECAKILESQIQKVFGKKFNIGYSSNRNQNWLGKQEKVDIDELSSIKFCFNKYPDIDPTSKDILKYLYSYVLMLRKP